MRSILIVMLVLLASFLGLGFILPDWTIFLLTIALAKGLAVLGVALLMQAGLVSFGQGLFYAAGAYTLGFAMRLLNLQEALLVTILGVVAGMAVAGLVGLLIARYREIFFAMLSLAFTMALWGALQKSTDITGGDDGMGIVTPTILGTGFSQEQLRLALYFYTLVWAAVAIYLVYRYLDSPLGYAVRAVKDNEVRVEYLGVSVQLTIYVTYILAAGLGGLSGTLVALNVGHITPSLAYWATSGGFVSVALLGGTGNVFAPLLGSIAFEFIRSEAASRWPDAWQLIIGVIMLAVILFMPRGLWTIVEAAGRKVRR